MIRRKTYVEVEEFYAETEISPITGEGKYAIPSALKACQKEHEALFMPSIIDARINSPKESRIWQTWWITPSTRTTGKTRQGNAVVVYAHIPSYFSNPENIMRAMIEGRLRDDAAGTMHQLEFQKLVDLNEATDEQGNRLVWVVDYDKLKNSVSDIMPLKKDSDLEQVLEHPQTIPFVGGEARAKSYLKRHKEVYGDKIDIRCSDDLSYEPKGRLLFVGNTFGSSVGLNELYIARFAGVLNKSKSAEGTLQKIF